MIKETPTYRRLNKVIDDIKKDLELKASLSYLARKHSCTQKTMLGFLRFAGLKD